MQALFNQRKLAESSLFDNSPIGMNVGVHQQVRFVCEKTTEFRHFIG
jgi:hypothetical protein